MRAMVTPPFRTSGGRPVREPVQLRGRMTDASHSLACRNHEAAIADPASEAVLVEGSPEDRLVDEPQISQAEGVGQQLEADRGVVQLAADAFDGHPEDLGVVEGEGQLVTLIVKGLDRPASLTRPGDSEPREPQAGVVPCGDGMVEPRG